jgi:predicted small secreted protein
VQVAVTREVAVPNPLEVNMKRFTLSFLLLAITALSACHTVEGVGKDVQEVGEEVEETAQGN